VYLPGEVAKITVSVKNPTTEVLEVLSPFWADGAGFDLFQKGTARAQQLQLEYAPVSPDPHFEFPPNPLGPTIQVLPGQVVTKTIRSDESTPQDDPVISPGVVPLEPGQYRLHYSYDMRANADFVVKRPVLEQFAKLDLYQEKVTDEEGTEYLNTRRIYGLVLVLDGKRQIMRTIHAWHDERSAGELGEEFSAAVAFSPYERIAEVAGPVTALRLEKQPDGQIKFLWSNEAGAWSELVVPGEEPHGTLVPFSISVTPTSAAAPAAQRRKFVAAVTGVAETGVAWTATLGAGAPAGAQPGSMSWDGYYVAPAIVSSNYPVIVTARSKADPTKTATATVSLLATEAIPAPNAPSGPRTVLAGVLQGFAASGASSNLGHPLQYSFDWGDGTFSGWTPAGVTSSFHTWSRVGLYRSTVQSRCIEHPTVVSAVSPAHMIVVSGEYLTTPARPAGPVTGRVGVGSTYSTGGSMASLPGHGIQYRLVWGDGSVSGWLPVGTTSASKNWVAAGEFWVKAEARCATHREVLAPESEWLLVTVTSQ